MRELTNKHTKPPWLDNNENVYLWYNGVRCEAPFYACLKLPLVSLLKLSNMNPASTKTFYFNFTFQKNGGENKKRVSIKHAETINVSQVGKCLTLKPIKSPKRFILESSLVS